MNIRHVQEALDLLDIEAMNPGKIDGILGPQTRNAVAAFQKAFGLPADGEPDEVTFQALKYAVCNGMPVADEDAAEEPVIVPEKSEAEYGGEKYLHADGFYHIPRGVNCQLSKNLWANEIHCQGNGCCTESVISKRIVALFQEIRDDMGSPLSIGTVGGSGYRCRKHNAEIPGASSTSLHMKSEAVDIHYANPSALKSVVLRHLKDGEVGLYAWGCHVGCWDLGYISQFNG